MNRYFRVTLTVSDLAADRVRSLLAPGNAAGFLTNYAETSAYRGAEYRFAFTYPAADFMLGPVQRFWTGLAEMVDADGEAGVVEVFA